jgi:hypothetical protein
MSTNITHKKSAVPGKSPTTSQLEFGEIAINTYDGTLYFKKDDGSGEAVVSITNSEADTPAINVDGSGLPQFNPEITADEIRSLIQLSSTDTVDFNKVNTPTLQITGGTGTEGTLTWNADEETLDLSQNGVTLQVGQESHVHVRNNTGSTIPKGTVVMATGTLGASGRITVAPYDGTSEIKYVIGVTTEVILNGTDGKATVFGKVRGIDTSAFAEGAVLHTTTNGGLTDVVPTSGISNAIAFVISSKNNGTIMVRFTPHNEIIDLHAETAFGWGDWSTGVDKTFVDNLEVDAATVNGLTVETSVPSGAVFTDTVYTHPSTHPATMITTTDEFAYSNSSNVQDVLDDLDQAIANVNAKDPVITLTGDVTGSGTMTNLGNVSITATIADDSHNHTIANVDGLQAALDGKVDDSQVLTNVPTGAVFTDTETTTTLSAAANILTYTDEEGNDTNIDLSLYIDDTNLARIVSGTMDGNGIATFTRDDATTFTVDMSVLLDDTNLSRITTASWNTSDGVLTLTRNDATTVTADLDGRYSLSGHTHNYVSKTGDTMTGVLNISKGGSSGTGIGGVTGSASIDFRDPNNSQNVEIVHDPFDTSLGESGYGLRIRKSASNTQGTFAAALTVEGNIYALNNQKVFHDGYHPNADKWTNARTLSLTGDVTGSTTWDGSGNASITATIADDSHSHSNYLLNNTADVAGGLIRFSSNLSVGTNDNIYLYESNSTDKNFAIRTGNSDAYRYFTFRGDESNLYVGGSKFWHAGNDGSGSGLDADLLDGQHGSYYNQSQFTGAGFTSRDSSNPLAVDSITTNTVGYTNQSTAAGFADGGLFTAAYSTSWVSQIFSNFRDGHISVRGKNNGTWQPWHKVWDSGNDGSGSGLDADLLDGQHASAFASVSHTHSYLPLSGGTLDNGTNTTLVIRANDNGLALLSLYGDSQGTGAVEVGQSSAYGGGISYNGDGTPAFVNGETSDRITFYAKNNGTRTEVFSYAHTSTGAVDFNGTVTAPTFSGSFSGNASTATKLATARTLSLTGDVTGSTTFDGSGNASITAVVANDSHNHDHSDGNFTVNGNLIVGSPSDTDSNVIEFAGTTGDVSSMTYIGERIYSSTEKSELLIFKGNDIEGASGSDRIRLFGNSLVFDVYSAATSGSFDSIATSANATRALTIDQSKRATFAGDIAVQGGNISVANNAGGVDFSDNNSYWLRTANNWGIYWNTSNNQIQFHGSGNNRWSCDLDNGTTVQAGDAYVNGGNVYTGTSQQRVKLSVWDSASYGIGMGGGYTFGGINNEYVMSFQMNDDSERGFWWGDNSHSNAQGAMSLTTNGLLTVANGARIGFGESDTTSPTAGEVQINGLLTATQKSFTIDHPTKEGYKLRYGSLEGPENGVYVRGRLKDNNTIELPEYWKELVHEDSITVELTAIGGKQSLWVVDFDNEKVVVESDADMINCFYTVYGERKDVEKLVTEFKEVE